MEDVVEEVDERDVQEVDEKDVQEDVQRDMQVAVDDREIVKYKAKSRFDVVSLLGDIIRVLLRI